MNQRELVSINYWEMLKNHDGDEFGPKKHTTIFRFSSNIHTFHVFEEGKFILVGGKEDVDSPVLKMLMKTAEGYKIDKSLTEHLHIDGHVTQMVVASALGRIYVFDNVKHR